MFTVVWAEVALMMTISKIVVSVVSKVTMVIVSMVAFKSVNKVVVFSKDITMV